MKFCVCKRTLVKSLFASLPFYFASVLHASVLSSDFNDPGLVTGIYSNGSSITSGTLTLVVTRNNSNFTSEILSSSSSNVLRFTNDTSVSVAGGAGVVSDVSTMASSNYLSGSYTFIPLSISSGNRTNFVFAISSTTQFGSSLSAIQFTLASNLSFSYYNGTSASAVKNGSGSNLILSTNTSYTIQWWADFTSISQDVYGFSLYDSSGTLLYDSGTLFTRAANITPSYMLLTGDVTGSAGSTDAFVEINSVSIANTIPELSVTSLLFMGIIILAFLFTKKPHPQRPNTCYL